MLKKLAYKYEVLSLKDILVQYTGFISKVEKGKFKWGSRKDLNTFEQQLMYNISVSRVRSEPVKFKSDRVKSDRVKDDRKKYCLEFNKGTCKLQGPHEGLLNSSTVLKYHICKKCLMDENVEHAHPSKDCTRK